MMAPADDGSFERQRTVLHIEDNLDSLELVETMLRRLPWVHVMAAMQGRLGLDLARHHQPALILLDVDLPDIPGLDVLRQLREHERTRLIPVITFGPETTRGLAAHLHAAGAHAHLTKPLNIGRLLGLTAGVLA